MSKLDRRAKYYKNQQHGRKKHVETMFITNKHKNHPYYFKPTRMDLLLEKSPFRLIPSRGAYYLRSLGSGYLTIGPLKAIVRLYKWFIKSHGVEEGFRYRLYTFPDFVLTAKPREVRMGKGKGGPDKKVSVIKKGQLVLSLNFENQKGRDLLARALLKKMVHKLPFKTIITTNRW